jgi:hypothetical protein
VEIGRWRLGEDDIVVSRKGIIAYLKPIIGLSEDQEIAWNKIRRWKKRYGMSKIIHYLPSGQCMISKAEFMKWIKMSDVIAKSVKEKALNKGITEKKPGSQ